MSKGSDSQNIKCNLKKYVKTVTFKSRLVLLQACKENCHLNLALRYSKTDSKRVLSAIE